ncbi:MAG: MFS transporter [Acidobacteria bacterium 13_1_40CM_4_65_8]|nr:MAG: MFS transporter [Acidobacteria bacterium 13_1_40CM_4_65_8]
MTRSALKIRHLILFVLCLMYFIAYIDRVNISVAGPMLRKELGLTPTELGLIFSAFAYPYAAMQIAGGWMSDRFGPRLVLAVLSLLWATATILTGLSWSVASLVAFRILVGVGEGGAFPAATRALTCWLPIRERGFAQGITHSFARLGGALTPSIVLAIVARYGWRESFIVLGAASLAWTAVWVASFRDTPDEHPWVTAPELAAIRTGGESTRAARGPTPWRQIVSRMWLVTVVDFCYGWSLWVFLTWLPSYLSDARGFRLDQIALMTTLPLLGGVVGDTLGGVISDAIFRRTGNLRVARRTLLVVGLVGASAFILPAIVTGSAIGAVYLLAAAFFFLELTNAVLWTLPIDIAGRYAGTAGGIMNTGFGVAGMISPLVFGVLIHRTGHYELPFFISVGLLLVGALCSLGIDPTLKVEAV